MILYSKKCCFTIKCRFLNLIRFAGFCSSLIFVFSIIRPLDYPAYFVWSQRFDCICEFFDHETEPKKKKDDVSLKKKGREDAHTFFCLSIRFDSAKVRRKTTKTEVFVPRQASIIKPFILEYSPLLLFNAGANLVVDFNAIHFPYSVVLLKEAHNNY